VKGVNLNIPSHLHKNRAIQPHSRRVFLAQAAGSAVSETVSTPAKDS
jgi:hypothetical protein